MNLSFRLVETTHSSLQISFVLRATSRQFAGRKNRLNSRNLTYAEAGREIK